MTRRALALAVAGVALALPAFAEAPDAFDASRIPEALRPWIPWVADPTLDCPLLAGRPERECVWAGPLALDVDAAGARFTQRYEVFGPGAWVELPGDDALRPQEVRANGQPLAVVANDAPIAWLARGRHELDGWLRFATRPATLPVPAATAIVALTLDREPVALARRDESGHVWLEARAAEPAPEDALDVLVFRRLADEVPVLLETRLVLRVAGRPREVVLGPVLPKGFVPLALAGSVPARLESDGRLRAQLRPGESELNLRARHEGPVTAIVPPETAAGSWAAEEVWVFDARPVLRIASVEGVAAIDPNQTELPPEWRQLPAYAVRPGETMRLDERRRGDPDPHDELRLTRTWWLDFDGGGLTFRDAIAGRLRKTSRLEMPAPSALGRVAIGGREWFLTTLGGAPGVEAPPGALFLSADGRVENADKSALPAIGWSQDMDAVEAGLHLPPGWSLLHVFGADRATPTWVASWTLLDFFLVLVTAAAAWQLFGISIGALGLAALVLTWIEPGAPNLVWIAALAAEALVRVLRGRRIVGTAAQVLRVVAWIALALHVIPYAVGELRRGLYLAYVPNDMVLYGTLGRMTAPAADAPTSGAEYASDAAGDMVAEEEIVVPAPREVAPEPVMVDSKVRRYVDVGRLTKERLRPRDLRALDPDARIPTGPGVPVWRWSEVKLTWSGPVRADQTIHLVLVSPFFSRVLSFARVLLLAALIAALVRGARQLVGPLVPPDRSAAAAALAAACLVALLAGAPVARAELPSPELLAELKERVEKEPACAPSCASVARLSVELRDDRLRLRIEAHASVATALPLPDGEPETEGFGIESVIVDARASEALSRSNDGAIWVALAPGVHDVLLDARVAPGADRVEIALPMRPGAVTIDAPGWTAEGLDSEGGAASALSLRRVATPGAAPVASLQPAPPPLFAHVARSLQLDVAWRVETRVLRLSAPGQVAVIEVPLLEGEALATEGIPVQDGKARVAFAADATEVAWSSTLAPRETIALRAPEAVSWVESWLLAVEPIWHVDAEGIPPIAVDENDPAPQRAWRPWPGESLTLRVRRPEGVGGATLTIDAATILVTPGLRSRDAALTLDLRSTQGSRHTVVLPEGVELRAVRVDGREQPIRAEGREVSLPIRPGSQEVRLEWRSDERMSWRMAIPEVALGAPAVNLTARIDMPEDRWILAVAGPRMGPAVLFWSVVGVLVLVAYGLSRVRNIPLRFHHWLLLGLGLTQVPVWMGAVVAGWFFAVAWRRERGASLGPLAFDALQVALAIGTATAIVVLFAAIQQGLLGPPEMQIAGNDSTARALVWYQDRSAGGLPDASVVSVPLFVYRLAMLAWALWLAMALLRWLRWGFESYATGGLWRSPRTPGKI